jgi:cytochrome P450
MNQRAPPRDTGACPIMHTDYRVDRPVLEHRTRLSADREAQPFYWNDSTEHGFWMVTRFADVLEALNMPEAFNNRQVNAFDKNMALHLLPQTLNGQEHRKLRAVLNPYFAPAAVKRMEAVARERAIALIEEIRPRKSVDMANEFGMQYPTEIFLALLGLPTSDGLMFLKWVEDIFGGFFGGPDAAPAAKAAGERIQDYFRVALEERERSPRDPKTDLVTRLLVARIDDQPIPREDLLTICMTLMAAGLDTTRSALGYIFHHLAHFEADRRRLIRNPSEWTVAVDEFVRLYPLVFQDGRQATDDIEFHGCPVRAGDMLWLGLGSANQDPRQFENPERFDPSRKNLRDHVGFGSGPHRCLGMHLAKAEIVIVMQEWLARIPEYRIAAGAKLTERGGQLRIQHLPLEWD